MQKLLLRFLPHALMVVAILGAIAWIDHRGYARARKDAEFDRLSTAFMLTKAARRIEAALGERIAAIDAETGDELRRIETINRTVIQPVIEREIRNAPRLSDPALGISDGLRAAINAAIGIRADPAAPARSVTIPLSDGGPAPDQ